MPGERGVLSLLFAVLLAGSAIYLPQSSSPTLVAAAPARAAAAQLPPAPVSAGGAAPRDGEVGTPTQEQLRQVAQTHGDAVTLIAEHFGIAAGPDPAWFLREALEPQPQSASLITRRIRRLASLKQAIAREGVVPRVDFLVATVPDPIDSNTRWQFDPMYDSLQRAISATGYVLDRFYIPDWDSTRNPDTDARAGNRLHERLPGVVLFRKGVAGRTELLVLFLVFETATSGVHQEAFRNAVWTLAHWAASDSAPPTVRIIGPMFSGSIPSLGRAMESVRAELPSPAVRYRVITGAATSAGNAAALAAIVRTDVSYRSTVLNDEEILSALGAFFDGRVERRRMAVLVEGNTAYGSALRMMLEGNRLCTEGCAILPFPLHISRLRGVAATGASASVPADGTRNIPLLLDEPVLPRDQVPPMAPRLTSSSTDVALAGILSTIDREHLAVVGLFATDARDKLFLAQQIALRSPDTLIFTIEGDVLLEHSDFRRYTQGMIVAASYPLFTGTQLWSPTITGADARHQFVSTAAQGVYNAVLAMLNYSEAGAPLGPSAPPLIDYRQAGADVRHGPFAWISVVGRDGIWPLHRDAVCRPLGAVTCAEAANYTQRTEASPAAPGAVVAAPDRPIHPSPWLLALFIALEVFVLAHVLSWRTRGRSWPTAVWWASADRGRRRRGFTLALACLGVLLVTQFVALVVINGHNQVVAGYGPSAFEALRSLVAWQPAQNGDAILIGFVAELVAALLLGLLVAVAIATGVTARDATARPMSDGRTLAFGVAAGAGLAFLLPNEGLLGGQPLTLLNRGLQPFNGVSPFAPVFIVLIAAYAWPAAQLARVATPSLTELPDDQDSRLAGLAIGNFVRLVRNVREAIVHPVLHSWNWVGVACAIVAGALFTYVQGVQTTERALYDFFYAGAWVLMQAFVCIALAQHYQLWRATKRLLKGLALHPMADVYRDVPRELFANRLPPRGPRLIHLQHAATAQAVFMSRAATIGGPIEAAHAPLLQATLDRDLTISGCHIAESATWTELLSDMRVLIPWVPLLRPRTTIEETPASSGHAHPTWDVAAERFLVIPIALMLRELVSRIVRGIYAIFASLVLLLVYQVSFPVYPQRPMMAITWVYVLAGVCTAVATVVSIERDGVMSRLAGTSAGKIVWDAAFLQRTALPLIFALLTLFAVQFPGTGNTLLQWLRPMQTVLP